MGTRHLLRSIGLAVVVLAFAGCGGAHDDQAAKAAPTATTAAAATVTPAATPGPTHAAFVKALDATCTGSTARFKAAAEAAGDDTDQLAPIVGSYTKRLSQTLERQKQLAVPPGDRRAFRRYLATQRQMVGVYQRMAAALHDGDIDETRYLLGLVDGIRADRTKAAVDLGLRRCGG